jgi:hypothetical protein
VERAAGEEAEYRQFQHAAMISHRIDVCRIDADTERDIREAATG